MIFREYHSFLHKKIANCRKAGGLYWSASGSSQATARWISSYRHLSFSALTRGSKIETYTKAQNIPLDHRKSYYISYYSDKKGVSAKLLKRPYLLEPVIRLELTT